MEPEQTVDAEEHEGLLDKLRYVGVGTEDPNIVATWARSMSRPARMPTATP